MKKPKFRITVWNMIGDEEEIVREYLAFNLEAANDLRLLLEGVYRPIEHPVTISYLEKETENGN